MLLFLWIKNIMKTEPIYLTDPYKKSLDSIIISVNRLNDKETELILDKTIFYPFGGGQPSDQGTIALGKKSGKVIEVRLSEDEIIHKVQTTDEFSEDEEISCELDWNRRYKNMKVHSAGHIIDFALVRLGLNPNKLTPIKANHGSKSFIEYIGDAAAVDTNKLNEEIKKIISEDLEFSWEFVTLEELEKDAVYLQPGLPKNKPLRKLTLKGVGSVADGGTIVKQTSEVEAIEIKDIVQIGENIQINYQLGQASKKSEKANGSDEVILDGEFADILSNINTEIESKNTEEELTELWRKYLGKTGEIKDLMGKISEIAPVKRKEYGQGVNALRNEADKLINSAKENLKNKKVGSYLSESVDSLTNEKSKVGHLHPLTETINEINEIFIRLGYSVYDGPELETDEYLFQRCNLPMHHPARDLQDSIFVDEPNILLRTQTSSVEAHALEDLEPPFKIVVPGRAYRNEKVNKSNHFLFHQYQLVCVQEKVSMTELFATITHMFKEFYGDDVKIRFRNKYYPEVEPGAGADMQCTFCKGDGCVICKKRGWLEMAGCGIIHPNMLRMAGLDTDKWQGFAFGFGLDRLAMTKHGISDIRTLLGGNLAYKPHSD